MRSHLPHRQRGAVLIVALLFLVMLTLLLSLRAHERSTAWSFALAGAAAGLAGATKYNGVLAVLMPLIACLMTPAARPSRPVAMLWIVTAMLAAFFVAAPYTFLDLPTFLNQFARLSSEFRAPPVTPEPIWQIYLKHLRNAFTPQYFQALGSRDCPPHAERAAGDDDQAARPLERVTQVLQVNLPDWLRRHGRCAEFRREPRELIQERRQI